MAFFSARTILDGIDDLTYREETLAFVSRLVEFFLTTESAQESYLIAKSVLLFVDQGAKLLSEFKTQTPAIIRYLFAVYGTHEKLKALALRTLLEFCVYCKHNFS